MPAIKYDDTQQRLTIVRYYESKGYHTEFHHEVGLTGVFTQTQVTIRYIFLRLTTQS